MIIEYNIPLFLGNNFIKNAHHESLLVGIFLFFTREYASCSANVNSQRIRGVP